jgi:hypothetical protein
MSAYTLYSQAPPSPVYNGPINNDPSTLGLQFSVSQAASLTGMWFYSGASAVSLPETIGVYTAAGTLVHSESPSWSGAAASGWVRSPFASPPSLTASTAYVGVVFYSGINSWYFYEHDYWDTGPGSSGLSNGPLSAPNNAGGAHGQQVFNSGSVLTFPTSNFLASAYWMDVEVTTSSGNVNGLVAAVAVAAPVGTVTGSGGGPPPPTPGLLMAFP